MDALAIIIGAVLGLFGIVYAGVMQSRQTSATRRTETTAAEIKGKTDTTEKVLDAWGQMVSVQNEQIAHLTNRLDEVSKQLNRCEEDKVELRKHLVEIEITLARSAVLPDPPPIPA